MNSYLLSDLAWAAGLFEGEGSFYLHTSGKDGKNVYCKASLGMTDQDVVERFASIVGFGAIYTNQLKSGKTNYKWAVASFEYVQAVVCLLWSQLGERRKAKAIEILRIDTHMFIPHGATRPGPMKLNVKQVKEIRRRSSSGETNKAIGISLGVDPSTVSDVKNFVSWKNV